MKYNSIYQVFIAALLLFSFGAQAQEADWMKQRKQLFQIIDKRSKVDAKKKVDKKALAHALKLKWPVVKPKKTKQEVEQEITNYIKKQVKRKYPDSLYKKFEKEAAEKYKLYKKDDEVSFEIRDGLGTNTLVEGRFKSINDVRLKIGSRYIIRKDISKDDLARFDPVISEEYKKNYVRVETAKLEAKKEVEEDSLKRNHFYKFMDRYGYMLRPKKNKNSTNMLDWISKEQNLENYYNWKVEAIQKKIKPAIERDVFKTNGYILFEKDGKKEWMPEHIAKSILNSIQGNAVEDGGAPGGDNLLQDDALLDDNDLLE